MRSSTSIKAYVPAMCLLVPALILLVHSIKAHLAPSLWASTWSHPDLADPNQLVVLYSLLPRAALAPLAGAALAMAGVIFQRIMLNPLAEPATLGTSAGAYLALTIGTLIAPGLVGIYREAVALAGGVGATLLVFLLAVRRGLAPGPLVMAGLLVTFTCGSLSSVLLLYANPYDLSLYLWGAGSLSQNDWNAVTSLLPRIAGCILLIVVLARSLTVLGLEETSARSLGLPVFYIRLAALAVAVYLSVAVVCTVGVIGFIGLVAPAICRLAGGRTLLVQLVASAITGAALLLLTDQLLQLASSGGREWLPTGAATSLLGTPVLLVILLRARMPADPPRRAAAAAGRIARHRLLIASLLGLLIVTAYLSLNIGKGIHGWAWTSSADFSDYVAWRGPRTMGAAAAGAMLAMAGAMLQRLTGNDMASPELLGLGGGATVALTALLLMLPSAGLGLQMAVMLLGALAMVTMLLAFQRRSHLNPDRLLVSGVALAALSNVLVVAALSTGIPSLARLKIWMAGATDQLGAVQASVGLGAAILLVLASPILARWLEILPLGNASAQAIGVQVRRAQLVIIIFASALTAVATLMIGPLAFVGLMAPRLAVLSGLRQPSIHLFGSAIIGALIMVIADWCGRTLLFPYEIPAGLMAAVIGTPCFLWLLSRRARE